jgi:thiosulfate reductase cytochrome b subunit
MATHVEERPEHAHVQKSEYWRGVLYGLFPLAVLAGIIAGVLMLAALVREVIGISAFPLQQSLELIMLGSGLVLALVAVTLALIFTLRRVARWQRDGPIGRAQAALWALGVSAVVILLPVLLAFVLP